MKPIQPGIGASVEDTDADDMNELIGSDARPGQRNVEYFLLATICVVSGSGF